MTTARLPSQERGFTIIEISMVLVIIGLVIGGIVVGQDLIKAAKIRGTVAQIEQYNMAANTFRGKYSGIPGDLPNPNQFFAAVTNAGGGGQGDGDGIVEGISAANTICSANTCISGEAALFWYELSAAGLIPDAITTTDMANVALIPSDAVLPQAKIGSGSRIAISNNSQTNWFVIGNFGTAALVQGGSGTVYGLPLGPEDAFQIDAKIDDGLPMTGTVISIPAFTGQVTVGGRGHPAGAILPGDCYTIDTNAYATVAQSKENNVVACALGVKASF